MVKRIRTFSNDKSLVAERRQQIIDCAIKLFIKKGFDATTITDIARACNWSRGLFYHYLRTKDDVLYLIANDQAEKTSSGFQELRERCAQLSPKEAVFHYFESYLRAVHQKQDYQVFLNQLAARLPRKDREILFDAERFALDVLDEIIRRGIASGEFVVENSKLIAHNILLIGRVWADRRWFLQKHFSLEEYLQTQTEAILRMLGVRVPEQPAFPRIDNVLSVRI